MERWEADIKAGKAVVTSGCEVFEFGPKLVNEEEEEEADGTCYIQGTGGKGDDSMNVNDTDLSLHIPRDVEEISTSVASLER
ncbi:Zinc finger CCCH domain-containing protein 15 [Lemmus lemmus]